MYSYQPLTSTNGFDFRSSFTFSGQKKAPSSETKYSAVSMDMPSMDYMNSQSWPDFLCTSVVKFFCYLLFVLTFPLSAIVCLKLAHQYERIVLYRMGRLAPLKGPGIVLILPCIDRWKKIDMRTKAFNIPPTRVCTTDGCLLQVGGVIHFRIQNPLLMSNSVQDVNHSIRVISQSAMSSYLNKKKLQEVMSSKARFNYDIQVEINDVIREWGLEVGRVELSQPTVEVSPAPGLVSAKQASAVPGSGDSTLESLAQFAQHFMANHMKSTPAEETPEESEVDVDMAAEDLLNAVHMYLTEELVAKINATYEIHLADNEGTYYMDLKSGSGSCGKGRLPGEANPDVSLTMSLRTLRLLLSGKIGPFNAYSSGKLKLRGDMKKAMKLDELVERLKS